MSHIIFMIMFLFQAQPSSIAEQKAERLTQSAYLAFVDRDYMFTVEVVSPGVPIFNFVCLDIDKEQNLMARQVRLVWESRKVPGTTFIIDTADPKQPVVALSLKLKPRSSFGARLKGDFAEAREFQEALIKVGSDEFKLVPITSLNFESLVRQINHINLKSPDFSEDWRALNLALIGTRKKLRD